MSEEPELLNRMTDRTRKVLRLSAAFSKQISHDGIEPQDLLDALGHLGGVSDYVLNELGYLKKKAPEAKAEPDRLIRPSEPLRRIVAEAQEQAQLLGHNYVGTEHLLLALVNTNPELFADSAAVRFAVLDVLGHVE